MEPRRNDFTAIRLTLASAEEVRAWSHGEVTKADTLNYRTLRAEENGLFCERIFGPTVDWKCRCGKYNRVRIEGLTCDQCGVDITREAVRRERMGHIELAAPVAHIWYSKGRPSRIGLLLDIRPRDLHRVLYYAQHIVIDVDQEARASRVAEIEEGAAAERQRIQQEGAKRLRNAMEVVGDVEGMSRREVEEQVGRETEAALDEHDAWTSDRIDALEELHVGQLLSEMRRRYYKEDFKGCFEAGTGAGTVQTMLQRLDIDGLSRNLRERMEATSGNQRKRVIDRLRVVEGFRKSGNKPEQMILTALAVLPPSLRPILELDNGTFATSDVNDLYRRVIYRNNRIQRFQDMNAPKMIVRNEKRMLQEAVDALIDNGMIDNPITGSHGVVLKSLSDLLRGKQGRFRQNLLGKRVDYSGRSVIIVGPHLRMNQCGLPRYLAAELYKPFVMNKLVSEGQAATAKGAERMCERRSKEALAALEEVVKGHPVMLNRAPTLHRLGIQAFEPVLVDGYAIQLHPLVCSAFNADFDGDQMAVHLPLSREAVMEARRLMMSKFNILSPSSGEPIMSPALDMVLGCYYITLNDATAEGRARTFRDYEDAMLAYEFGSLGIRDPIRVQFKGEWLDTTLGRMIFNRVLPPEMGYINEPVEKGALNRIVAKLYALLGSERTGEVLDSIKELGFKYSTKLGTTIAINDLVVPEEKASIVARADRLVKDLEDQHLNGMLTDEERYRHTVEVWTRASDEITDVIKERLEEFGSIHLMAGSGAKGNIAQIKQMAGMRGLMAGPRGRIVERPIKSNFKEGLSALEFFISAHGARKGLTDTALNTAKSGYLTRRLTDAAEDVIVTIPDCGTGRTVRFDRDDDSVVSFPERIRTRYLAQAVTHPATGEMIAVVDDAIDDEMAMLLDDAGVASVEARSPTTCEASRGICQMCYGLSMTTLRPVLIGEAVGVIAAQSIGEPGTQLTMRTFHSGGVAGQDITDGLPRVEELFEIRTPKLVGVTTEIEGVAVVNEMGGGSDGVATVWVSNSEEYADEYELPSGYAPMVSDGDSVVIGERLAELVEPVAEGEDDGEAVLARVSGTVSLERDTGELRIIWTDIEEREYAIPLTAQITVRSGDFVNAGEALSSGPLDPRTVLQVRGKEEVERYIIEEVQKVYRSQGVVIHSKHIELIVGRMLKNVMVNNCGDSDLLPGDIMEKRRFEELTVRVLAEGGSPPTAIPVLLGITETAMVGDTDSFLAAAAFQETTRVLTDAAINGRVDRLIGLKENIIVGRLMPARVNLSDEGVGARIRGHYGLTPTTSAYSGRRNGVPEGLGTRGELGDSRRTVEELLPS